MASGPLPAGPGTAPGLKFFIYASEVGDLLSGGDGAMYLAQVILTGGSGDVSATIKTTSAQSDAVRAFVDILKAALSPLGLKA